MIHHDGRDEGVATEEAKKELESRLRSRIKSGREINAVALKRIEKTGQALNDFVVTLGGNGTRGCRFEYSQDAEAVRMHVFAQHTQGLDEDIDCRLHPHAVQQLSEKLKLPGRWIREQVGGASWQRKLVADILDGHAIHWEKERALVRMLDLDDEPEIRGILSTHYRRLDSGLIMGAFIDTARKQGAEVTRVHADATAFWIEALCPQVFPVETKLNGTEYIWIGMQYRTSDFGDGADSMSMYLERAWCTNKAILHENLRQIHLGGKLPDDLVLARDTYVAQSAAQAKSVRDLVNAGFQVDRIKNQLNLVASAAGVKLELDDSLTWLGNQGVTAGELKELQKVLMESDRERLPVGDLSRWKFSQAISNIAQGAKPRRRQDLETLAGHMLCSSSKNLGLAG